MITIYLTILAFFLGASIGSFINVLFYRLPRKLSIVRPRSFCPACKVQISSYDNIPVLSYFLLKGRCRHCKTSISIKYPVVELLLGTIVTIIIFQRLNRSF
ncbi:MAG: prepilin peptidase [Fibrobacteres bacterium]|nr:prepilin peptidase [Fibrobacterota bacterium]